MILLLCYVTAVCLKIAQNVEEIRDEIMECSNASSNEWEKLNQNLLEEIDEVITQSSNTNEPLAYDKNNSNSEFVEMQDMHGCLKEEMWLFLNYCNILLIVYSFNSIMTTYLSFEKANQIKSAILGAHRIIQEANSTLVSMHKLEVRKWPYIILVCNRERLLNLIFVADFVTFWMFGT